CVFVFFQAEDGIRDWSVTGVQTCALPICQGQNSRRVGAYEPAWSWRAIKMRGVCRSQAVSTVIEFVELCLGRRGLDRRPKLAGQIGRASCRERGERLVGGG